MTNHIPVLARSRDDSLAKPAASAASAPGATAAWMRPTPRAADQSPTASAAAPTSPRSIQILERGWSAGHSRRRGRRRSLRRAVSKPQPVTSPPPDRRGSSRATPRMRRRAPAAHSRPARPSRKASAGASRISPPPAIGDDPDREIRPRRGDEVDGRTRQEADEAERRRARARWRRRPRGRARRSARRSRASAATPPRGQKQQREGDHAAVEGQRVPSSSRRGPAPTKVPSDDEADGEKAGEPSRPIAKRVQVRRAHPFRQRGVADDAQRKRRPEVAEPLAPTGSQRTGLGVSERDGPSRPRISAAMPAIRPPPGPRLAGEALLLAVHQRPR